MGLDGLRKEKDKQLLSLAANGIGWVDQSYWMIDQTEKRASKSQAFLDFCTLAANEIE
jgi:hypothetical protein